MAVAPKKTHQNYLKSVHGILKGTPVFSTFPLSLLFVGLEKLIEIEMFSCPCTDMLNKLLTVSIFTGPALFTYALMFLLLRPFKHTASLQKKTLYNGPKKFLACLIPPVLGIIILLLDGDYFACAMTDWKGFYEFDEAINRSWCKPPEGTQNVTELRGLTWKHVHQSQCAGYVLISVFSVLMIVFLGIHDCCIRGRCDCCPSRLLCCKRTEEKKHETEEKKDETEEKKDESPESSEIRKKLSLAYVVLKI